MKKLFSFLFIMISVATFGQKNKYVIDFNLQKIVYEDDSIVFDAMHSIEIKTSKISDIIEIGHINDTYFGVQFEILKSDLGSKNSFIAGRVYYIKTANTDWEKYIQFRHDKVTVQKLSKQAINKKNYEEQLKNASSEAQRKSLMTGNSETTGDPVKFGIYYKIHFYVK